MRLFRSIRLALFACGVGVAAFSTAGHFKGGEANGAFAKVPGGYHPHVVQALTGTVPNTVPDLSARPGPKTISLNPKSQSQDEQSNLSLWARAVLQQFGDDNRNLPGQAGRVVTRGASPSDTIRAALDGLVNGNAQGAPAPAGMTILGASGRLPRAGSSPVNGAGLGQTAQPTPGRKVIRVIE